MKPSLDARFLAHNSHLEHPGMFRELDPNLRRLKDQVLVHKSRLLDRLPRAEPGVYTITGGRQVGKTTLIKQFMASLMEEGLDPWALSYFTGELIDDHHSLVNLLEGHLSSRPESGTAFVFLDEVTYTREWDRGVKFLSDAGLLDRVILILTGSDLVILKEAVATLPGRRGRSGQVDFRLYPLGFLECVQLKEALAPNELDGLLASGDPPPPALMDRLFEHFESYLIHGGFLTAINDMARDGRIAPATLSIYADWIRGDMFKRGKQEGYLREVLAAVVKRAGSQITWNSLAKDLSIDHPKTVSDYVGLLESMDVLLVQAALREDQLAAAPKKARKVFFSDPFILHAVRHWLNPTKDPHGQQIEPFLANPETQSFLAEACAVSLFSRHFPTYYIKAQGEVDIAYVHKKRFWPVEIKWTRRPNPKAFKQLSRYKNARILDRSPQSRKIQNIPTEPLPLALLRLEAGQNA